MKSYSLSNIRSYSKQQWKCIVRKAVLIANRNDLLEKAKNYKKIDAHTMSQEQSTLKPYFRELNVPDARLYFAVRSKMTKTVQMNYKGVDKFRKNHWKCSCKINVLIHIKKDRKKMYSKKITDTHACVQCPQSHV